MRDPEEWSMGGELMEGCSGWVGGGGQRRADSGAPGWLGRMAVPLDTAGISGGKHAFETEITRLLVSVLS